MSVEWFISYANLQQIVNVINYERQANSIYIKKQPLQFFYPLLIKMLTYTYFTSLRNLKINWSSVVNSQKLIKRQKSIRYQLWWNSPCFSCQGLWVFSAELIICVLFLVIQWLTLLFIFLLFITLMSSLAHGQSPSANACEKHLKTVKGMQM